MSTRCIAVMAWLVTTGLTAPAQAQKAGSEFGADRVPLPIGIGAKGEPHAPAAIGQLRHTNQEVAAASRPHPLRWESESDQAFALFGTSVGTAGDVNGDGYEDVIVGAPGYSNGQTGEGGAFVYYGSASGLPIAPDWTAESDQAGANFGIALGTARDVNGDGYDDVIVGASSYYNGEFSQGRAFVYHGSGSGLSITPDWTAESDQFGYFGDSVGAAGDVNGDGYDDVIVGDYSYTDPNPGEGKAWVYYGSASGLSTTPDWGAGGDQSLAGFGISVATAGDVNGDGYGDLIVGAFGYEDGQQDEGRALVYFGSASGPSILPDWSAESDQVGAHFGGSVGTAGDVNGDGYDDVIVGANFYDNGQKDEGRAFVYHGSVSGLSATADWTAESNQTNAYFGWSVGTAGDFNGDHYADVLVGAPYYDKGQTNEGRVVAYYGSVFGLSTTPDRMAESDQVRANFGESVGAAGDVNSDGYDDGIGGAPRYTHGQTEEGAAVVYLGRPGAVTP